MDPATRAEIKLHMAVFAQENPNATLGELIKSASKVMPEASKKDLEQVAVELLVSEPGTLGAKAQARVRQQHEIKPTVPDTLKEVFASIVEEFRNESLSMAGSFAMQLHILTGGSMGEFAKRLASSSPLTEEMIVQWMREWQDRTGKLPTKTSGGIPGTTETWSAVGSALESGCRCLPGGSSLFKLAIQKLGVEAKRDLTIPWILDEMRKHHKRTGKYPTEYSGNITGTTENWGAVNIALRRGLRGLPGGSSLHMLGVQHLGAEEKRDLTIPWILDEMRKYHKRTGKYPSSESGPIPGTSDTWKVGPSRKSAPIVSTWRAPPTTAVSLSRSPRFAQKYVAFLVSIPRCAQKMSRSSSRSPDSRRICLVPRLDPQVRAEYVSFLVSIPGFAEYVSFLVSIPSLRGICLVPRLDPQVRAEDVSFLVSIVHGAPMGFIKVVFVRPKEACCFVNTRKLYQNLKYFKCYNVIVIQFTTHINYISH